MKLFILANVVMATTAVKFHPDQQMGDMCGTADDGKTIFLCGNHLNCDEGTCQRWPLTTNEKSAECGPGLFDDRVDMGCADPLLCVDRVCIRTNLTIGDLCDKHSLCRDGLDCIDSKCTHLNVFYQVKDWLMNKLI